MPHGKSDGIDLATAADAEVSPLGKRLKFAGELTFITLAGGSAASWDTHVVTPLSSYDHAYQKGLSKCQRDIPGPSAEVVRKSASPSTSMPLPSLMPTAGEGTSSNIKRSDSPGCAAVVEPQPCLIRSISWEESNTTTSTSLLRHLGRRKRQRCAQHERFKSACPDS